MKDCKGKEIRTGDIVLIAGAYFQITASITTSILRCS